MKIISKETINSTETKHSKRRDKPRETSATKSKNPAKKVIKTQMKQVITEKSIKPPVQPSIVTTPPKVQKKPKLTKDEVTKKRIAHIEAERDKRKAGQSYFSVSYDRFVSLIRFNITFKLTIGYAIRLVFLIAFLFFFVYISFSYYLFYDAQQTIKEDIRYIGQVMSQEQNYQADIITDYLDFHTLSYYVYDSQHIQIFSNTDDPVNFDTAMQISEYNLRDFPNFPTLFETDSILLEDGTMYYIALKSNMQEQTNNIEATFPIGFVLCFVLILSSIRSASKMAKKHLKPIVTMTDQVKDMSANNLSTRLNVSGTKDELKDLALTFNQMLTDIQKSYEREKQFVSDASHELRTPIAVIKGYAGMLNRWGKDDPAILEESIQAILGETDNMHSLVESLLFIARNDKGTLKMDTTKFSFSDLVTEIVKETRLIDTQHQIIDTLETDIFIHGSADKLKQAFRIFIDNSIKYTPDSGEIKITLRRSEKHSIIVLSDNGIGISKEDLPNIFDRFYRADKSRTKMRENQHGGTGLGLSIAKIIIEQHGGTIHVASELNEGTTFTIFLPILDEPVTDILEEEPLKELQDDEFGKTS
ncbi:ATP-binding protein [Fusibacter bizertensis]|uniref:histidine kinase n=1 Tax=Fusibacter bizertensis TaxID=1488331 RepID=A0ABT6NBA9_9FIRM|nr:ATP-binding protein [Fusibacter bizertensis]MDH8677704.1 ATP-binding protein [Fusibacter bizertensis]